MPEVINEQAPLLSRDELVELNSKSFEDIVLIVGKQLKSREVESDETELKTNQEKVLDSYLSSKPCTEDYFILLRSDQDEVVLEALRCLFWLLTTDRIEPGVDFIPNCLCVADKTSDFTTLLYVFKVLNQLSENSKPMIIRKTFLKTNLHNGAVLGKTLAKSNGQARLSKSLKRADPSIKDNEKGVYLITSKLNLWFIFTQGKLICPIPKTDVSVLIGYFTSMLVAGKHSEMIERQVWNILASLMNFQSRADQKDYVLEMVKNLGEPCADKKKVKASLDMLDKLAGRGRSGIIRRVEISTPPETLHSSGEISTLPDAESKVVLDCLTNIILVSFKDEKDLIRASLKLIIQLYEAPRYINEHKTLKTDEFVHFLTTNIGKFKYRRDFMCVQILRFLIFNDPHNEMLKSHIKAAKEIPGVKDTAGFTELFDVAEKKNFYHSCQKLKIVTYPGVLWFLFSYCKDNVLDLYIAIKGILSEEHVETSWLLFVFAILPLFVCNFISLNSFYSATPLSIHVSLEGHIRKSWLLRYLAPWRFDSGKHAFFNLLTFCMFHPVMTVIDFIAHVPQPIANILRSRYNSKKLAFIETMLENIPCLAIKVIQIAKSFTSNGFVWDLSNVQTVVTMANSVFSLGNSQLDFESTARFVDEGQWQITLTLQKATLLLGYLTMVSSRMLLILILTRFETWYWITAFLVFHVLVTFFIQLFSYHIKAGKGFEEDEHYVFLRHFDIKLIPFTLAEVFLVLLRSPMEYLGVYSKYQYVRDWRLFFKIYFFHLIEVIAVNLCFIFLTLQLHSNPLAKNDQPIFIISCVSIGLHLLSGLFLALYTIVFNPTEKKTKKFVPSYKRQILFNNEPEHDTWWREISCLKLKQNFCIDGVKVAKLDVEMNPSTPSANGHEVQEGIKDGPINAFVKVYRTRMDEEASLYDASDSDEDTRQKLVKKKTRFHIHGYDKDGKLR